MSPSPNAVPPAPICRNCYADIPTEENPTLKCAKCGVVNRPPPPVIVLPENRPAKPGRVRRGLAPSEGLTLAAILFFGFFFSLGALSTKGMTIPVYVAYLGGMILTIGLYFLPAIVGKDKKNANAILVLNIFLGWTLIGWVVALVWATTKDD